ncbi:hypothetical protein [Mucilaginibacter pedocola]|uniref:Uncharacterized protein n=1 Tax=Mucilaginibacter pedocola TaxID=1792845 RepID=A0A1S9P9H8_9SPHI|nr:hypothetical protein [Mucilaginibacter pedocola]OOQ57569.1 hypothetical protein BC343_12235 [Mucilaginibacter pedocola]
MQDRYLPFIAVFILTSVLLWVATIVTDCTCHGLNYYALSYDMFSGAETFVSSAGIFILGVLLYYALRRLFKPKRSVLKYTYWALLPLAVFNNAIVTTIHNLKVGGIERSICNKTRNNDGTGGVISKGLTLKEYRYIQNLQGELLNLPRSSKNITVRFYGGDFIGDFILQVDAICQKREIIKTGKNWRVKSTSKKNDTKLVVYSAPAK